MPAQLWPLLVGLILIVFLMGLVIIHLSRKKKELEYSHQLQVHLPGGLLRFRRSELGDWECVESNKQARLLLSIPDETQPTALKKWLINVDFDCVQQIVNALKQPSVKFSSQGRCRSRFLEIQLFYAQGDLALLIRDITEQYFRQRHNEELSNHFHLFLDTLPAEAFILNSKGHFIFVNHHMAVTRDAESWLGRNPEEVFPAKINQHFEQCRKIALSEGPVTFEENIIYVDESVHRQRYKLFPLHREGREPLLAGIAMDKTREMLAEKNLRHQEELFTLLMQNLPFGIFAKDVRDEYRYILWNPRMEKSRGLSSDVVLGHTDEEVFAPKEASLNHKVDLVIEQGKTIAIADEQVYGEAIERLISIPILDHNGDVSLIFGLVEDVTDRNELEDRLRQAEKMEAVGQLASGVAHDFSNLLQVIISYSELLQRELDPDLSENLVQPIQEAGKRAVALVRQLLTFSRKETSNAVPVELNAVVQDLTNMLGSIIGERVDLVFNPWPELYQVSADAGQLEQIIINLCVNARDAMPEGGTITISTSNLVAGSEESQTAGCPQDKNCVEIIVSDTGTGIPPEVADRMFEPFFTTKEPGKGTGLGLATVYGIVQNHKGLIQVESEPGSGTLFRIILPACCTEEETEEITHESPMGGNELILVAEDEDLVRRMNATALERSGYRVITAADGPEAIELFLQHRKEVDLLFLDIVMPGIDGKGVYEAIHSLRSDVPAVFCSGYCQDDDFMAFLDNHPGTALVQKPYESWEILGTVRELLNEATERRKLP